MSTAAETYVVTATYNEAENLPLLVEGVLGLGLPLCLVLVDDASPDGTGELADRLACDHPGRLTVIHREAKLGYASAQRIGMAAALEAGAEIVVTMDADLSHNPQRIPAMVAMLQDNDGVIGSLYVVGGGGDGWGWFRRLLSKFGGSIVTRLLSGLQANDCTSGFRAYRAEALHRADFARTEAEGYGFLVELLFRCQRAGARITEVPIIFTDRRAGQSKLSPRIIVESALLCFRLLWQRLIWLPRYIGSQERRA